MTAVAEASRDDECPVRARSGRRPWHLRGAALNHRWRGRGDGVRGHAQYVRWLNSSVFQPTGEYIGWWRGCRIHNEGRIPALPDGYCLQRTELWAARWGRENRRGQPAARNERVTSPRLLDVPAREAWRHSHLEPCTCMWVLGNVIACTRCNRAGVLRVLCALALPPDYTRQRTELWRAAWGSDNAVPERALDVDAGSGGGP